MSMASEPKPVGGGNWFAQNAELIAVVMIVTGFVLCAAAMMLGVDNVTFTGDFRVPQLLDSHVDLAPAMKKEVGYLWAPNWSIHGVLVLPLIVLFGLLTFRKIEPTLERMAARGMVRTVDTLKPVPAAELVAAWRRGDVAWTIVLGIIAVLATGFIAYDGWFVVTDPVSHPEKLSGIGLGDPAYEYDWSISCLYAKSRTDCGALTAFAVTGYTLIAAVSTVFAFLVAVVALRFMAFVSSAGNKRGEWLVVVDVKSLKQNEKRFGWDEFEPFFSNLLYWAIFVLFSLWLMVVQNSYLRDPNSDSVLSFIFADSKAIAAVSDINGVLKAFAADGVAVFARVGQWLFTEPSRFFFANWQTELGVVLFGLVCAIAVVGAWLLLRATALKSQEIAHSKAKALAAEAGMKTKAFHERLDEMDYWPVAWIGQIRLFGLMLLMYASVFTYRLMLVVLVLVIVNVLGKLFGEFGSLLNLKKKKKKQYYDDDDDEEQDASAPSAS
jgi:hypothetical protein